MDLDSLSFYSLYPIVWNTRINSNHGQKWEGVRCSHKDDAPIVIADSSRVKKSIGAVPCNALDLHEVAFSS